jgi:hypothetical protein
LTTITWTASYANTKDTFGTLASPTKTQIATGSFTVNSSIARYTASISIPVSAITGIEIEFSVGAQTSGTWTIGRVQLESNLESTPFKSKLISNIINDCQRYYEKSYDLGITPGTNTAIGIRVNAFQNLLGNSSSSQFYQQSFLVRKFSTPSITLYSKAGTLSKATQDDGSEINSSSENSSTTGFQTTSINTAGRYSAGQHFVAISEL